MKIGYDSLKNHFIYCVKAEYHYGSHNPIRPEYDHFPSFARIELKKYNDKALPMFQTSKLCLYAVTKEIEYDDEN